MKNVLEFFSELGANNSREWFAENKYRYEDCLEQFQHLVANLIMAIGSFDLSLEGLQPKECIYRIHRDVRFSNDKTPYKTSMGASISEGGKNSGNPTYYVHLEPGKSMLACGIYLPNPDQLKKIRQEIDYNAAELKSIISHPEFKDTYGVIKGEALKSAPRGYPKDHPNIELLRFKNFIIWTELDDSFWVTDNLVDTITSRFEIANPFKEYLSVAIS